MTPIAKITGKKLFVDEHVNEMEVNNLGENKDYRGNDKESIDRYVTKFWTKCVERYDILLVFW